MEADLALLEASPSLARCRHNAFGLGAESCPAALLLVVVATTPREMGSGAENTLVAGLLHQMHHIRQHWTVDQKGKDEPSRDPSELEWLESAM